MARPMAHEAALSARQAAQALQDLEYSEESLSTRVGSLTGMVWGIVSAAIFVTYGLAVAGDAPHLVFPFLWAPWTAAGIATSTALWKVHALALRKPMDRAESRAWGLGMTLLFGAALVALYVLKGVGAFALMTAVNGACAFVIVAMINRHKGTKFLGAPIVLAGVLMLAASAYLWMTELPVLQDALLAAGVCGLGFFLSGLYSFIRG